MRTILPTSVVLAAAFAAATTVMTSAAQRSRTEQSVLVTALTDASTPATGLTANDFAVREDSLAREILRVGAAPPPSHVVLVVDDSQAAEKSAPFLRKALAGFITRLAAISRRRHS
jgi:hypothetical protein